MALKLEVPSEALLQVYSGDPKCKAPIKAVSATNTLLEGLQNFNTARERSEHLIEEEKI